MLLWLIDGFAVWRIASLLVHEDGPYYMFRRLREKVGFAYYADGTLLREPDNHVLACVWCASVWVALLVSVLPHWTRRTLSLSTLAIMVEKYGNR